MIRRFPNEVWYLPLIRGCMFHIAQALVKKIYKLGLKVLFHSDPRIQERVNCYIALCFVPVREVPQAFQTLIHEDPIPEMAEFERYFERTWMGTLTNPAIYPIAMWNYYETG